MLISLRAGNAHRWNPRLLGKALVEYCAFNKIEYPLLTELKWFRENNSLS